MKTLAWTLWWILVLIAGAVGLVLLMFSLSGPDHAVASRVALLRTLAFGAGGLIPLSASLYFMRGSQFIGGLACALLMLPATFALLAVLHV